MKGYLGRSPVHLGISGFFVVFGTLIIMIALLALGEIFSKAKQAEKVTMVPCPYPIILSDVTLQKYTDCRVQELSTRR